MKKNIIFWGAKFKAGIIYDLIEKKKILINTKNLKKIVFPIFLESNLNFGLKQQQIHTNLIEC